MRVARRRIVDPRGLVKDAISQSIKDHANFSAQKKRLFGVAILDNLSRRYNALCLGVYLIPR